MVKTTQTSDLPLSAIFSVIVYYAKDGGPGEVWQLRSFYHDPLRC